MRCLAKVAVVALVAMAEASAPSHDAKLATRPMKDRHPADQGGPKRSSLEGDLVQEQLLAEDTVHGRRKLSHRELAEQATARSTRVRWSPHHRDLKGGSLKGKVPRQQLLVEELSSLGEHQMIKPLPLLNEVQILVDEFMSTKLVAADIFSHRVEINPSSSLLSSASQSEWTVLFSTCFVMLCFDVLVLQKLVPSKDMNFRILAFWIGVAAAYNAYYWIRYGKQQGLDWCTGYLLEWLLSADNLFVFHLVFKVYSTPAPLMHKALFVGIAGAVIFKMVFFLTLGSLMHAMDWIRFVFGAILIYSGIMAVAEEEEEDPDLSQLLSVRAVKSMLGSRLLPDYDIDGHRLFVSVNGKIYATLLVLVIFILEITDVIFAVDSVSAKVAQIDNQYTAYSSSVMAVFGLRAMFFVLNDLVDCFEHLKIGLCIILIFIGSELMLARWLHLGSGTVCCVIVAVMGACIAASVTKKRGAHKEGVECKLDA
mmetsp:Transcript_50270/g.109173  ORF Transcript_50270/g.109173 Transcript_50270/m.109173 type:complete len:481 (+) Transcript_50270:90-1532(+)|eukprot:CAMPEP_0170614578 /NCGR_PEP_ID=MMETSP0224-20130122/24880_1 /TAXON_ID=285029 /ORGANISM="Togula jolla, Strain CCCM 725" /LENGTH=480 /DNA_ID=CAMNT_0010940255 /DNA_START=90 /DNA_END=1532 /DNA_ORIENTATION=+